MTEVMQVTRWTAARKAQVVRQIETGELTEATAMATHGLSSEELGIWRRRYAEGGAPALRVQVIRPIRGGGKTNDQSQMERTNYDT